MVVMVVVVAVVVRGVQLARGAVGRTPFGGASASISLAVTVRPSASEIRAAMALAPCLSASMRRPRSRESLVNMTPYFRPSRQSSVTAKTRGGSVTHVTALQVFTKSLTPNI